MDKRQNKERERERERQRERERANCHGGRTAWVVGLLWRAPTASVADSSEPITAAIMLTTSLD